MRITLRIALRWATLVLLAALLQATALLLPGAAAAQRFYGGSGVGLKPAEPEFQQSVLLAPMAGLDLGGTWRLSAMQVDFSRPGSKPEPVLALTVLGAERLFEWELGRNLALFGALGAGWYDATLTGVGSTRRGSGVGLMADAGVRVFFTLFLFAELTFQYRDCGIQVASGASRVTVDGGWQGLGVSIGWAL
jgi:hypothetical protein